MIYHLYIGYGPVVRNAPDEGSFATREAANEVYTLCGSGYNKTSFYWFFEHFDTPSIFSPLNRGTGFSKRYNKMHIMHPENYFLSVARFLGEIIGFGNLRMDDRSSVRYVLGIVRHEPARLPAHSVLRLRLYEFEEADIRIAASECMDYLVAGLDTTTMCSASSCTTSPLRSSSTTVCTPDCANALRRTRRSSLGTSTRSTVHGDTLPKGTIVSCQPYTLPLLSTRVFPDADVLERWLEPEGAAEPNGLFFAFAAGGGGIGKSFAFFEMKLLFKDVYSAYRTRVTPGMTISMEVNDQVVSNHLHSITE
ncbi:hypothetical protein VTO73DRAFT_15289 [Trametes versicolor]